MRTENIKDGMKVKISDNPSYSIINYGSLDGYKKSLAGTIQRVQKIKVDSNRIRIVPPVGCGHNTISFHTSDLSCIPGIKMEDHNQSIPDIKPELFDPQQLVIN